MKKLGQAKTSEREVFYLSTNTDEWTHQLPSEKWLVLSITDTKDKDLWNKVAEACLNNKVTYICTVGRECEQLHDWFDETITVRRIHNKQPIDSSDNLEQEPMTTWHEDFGEGFWFSLMSAYDGDKEINKVVCLDLAGNGNEDKLRRLLIDINNGWMPDD